MRMTVSPVARWGDDRAPLSFRSFSGSDDPASNPTWQIMNTWEAHPAFQRLLYHPKVVSAVAQLCRTPSLAVWHDQVQYKPAEIGGATGWHQVSAPSFSTPPPPPCFLDLPCLPW